MNPNNRAIVTVPSDNEILITRVFAAPREPVFRGHTDPLLIPRWWGPVEDHFSPVAQPVPSARRR